MQAPRPNHETDRSLISWEQAVQWLVEHPDDSKRELAHLCYFDGSASEAAMRYASGGEWTAVKRFLPSPPGKALDLGAGRGISSFALAQEGFQVVALEPDPSALVGAGAISQIAVETGMPISVVSTFAEDLPFHDETFDVVYCRQALHHAANIEKMCGEAIRTLKTGGIFIATREHVLTRTSDLDAFLASHPLHSLYGGENAFTLERYVEAISRHVSDLKIIQPTESGINLFPSSRENERYQLSRIAGVHPRDIPDFVFKIRDHFDSNPGRLYSFVAVK